MADVPANQGEDVRPRRRTRILGVSAQVVGVLGIIVCALLVVGVLLVRGWAVDQVAEVSGTIDQGLAQAVPRLDGASTRALDASARAAAVADGATRVAASSAPAPALVDGLSSDMTNLTDRYLALRATYAEMREGIVSAVDRLTAVVGLLPGRFMPEAVGSAQGALATLDGRVRELDTQLASLPPAAPAGTPIRDWAGRAGQVAGQIETGLASAASGIDTVEARVSAVRAEVANGATTITTTVNLLTVLLVVVLVYAAVLHWVLFRSGGELRRRGS